jgi:lipoyl(octanoyl) transferase
MMNLSILRLGRVEYTRALQLQRTLLKKRQEGIIGDTLLLLEHPPVITLGRRGRDTDVLASRELLEKMGVKVCEIERGGEATYHGPGQIVGYMFISIGNHNNDSHQFVSNIEEVFIRLLSSEFGIVARRDDEFTGVWVNESKITAIGIAIKKKITMHGFAFNINTNLDHFKWIVPCGIQDKGVTSVKQLTGEEHELEAMTDKVVRYFCDVFGYTPMEHSIDDLDEMLSVVEEVGEEE